MLLALAFLAWHHFEKVEGAWVAPPFRKRL